MAGETIEKLVIQIQADIAKAQHDLNKVKGSLGDVGDEAAVAGNKVQTSGQKINAVLASMKIYAVAAAAALGAIGVKAIAAAGDAAEVRNMFEAVFKDSATSAEQWAEEFSDTVGRSVIETMETMASFQDTFVPLQFDRTEAAELSKILTELSADIASFKNTTDEEASMAIQSALVGNHEAVRKYGIVITEASLEQELFNMGIEKSVQNASTQEKVMARLNIIMNSTTDAQGDATKTAGTYANQMRALKGHISDVMAEAGQEGMSDLTDTLVEFNEWGTSGGYDNITSFLSDIASLAADAAAGVAILTTTFADLYGTVVSDGPMPEAMGTSGTMPGPTIGDLTTLSDEEMTSIYQQLGYNEDQVAYMMERRNALLEAGKEIIEDQVDETKELASVSSSIPDWAGHSDYIRGQIANRRNELGITYKADDVSTHMSIADIMSIASPSSAMRSTEQSINSTVKSVEQSAGVDRIVNLTNVNREGFETLAKKMDSMITAVGRINIRSSSGGSSSSTSDDPVSTAIAITRYNRSGIHGAAKGI
jgi:hypothetical protein